MWATILWWNSNCNLLFRFICHMYYNYRHIDAFHKKCEHRTLFMTGLSSSLSMARCDVLWTQVLVHRWCSLTYEFLTKHDYMFTKVVQPHVRVPDKTRLYVYTGGAALRTSSWQNTITCSQRWCSLMYEFLTKHHYMYTQVVQLYVRVPDKTRLHVYTGCAALRTSSWQNTITCIHRWCSLTYEFLTKHNYMFTQVVQPYVRVPDKTQLHVYTGGAALRTSSWQNTIICSQRWCSLTFEFLTKHNYMFTKVVQHYVRVPDKTQLHVHKGGAA